MWDSKLVIIWLIVVTSQAARPSAEQTSTCPQLYRYKQLNASRWTAIVDASSERWHGLSQKNLVLEVDLDQPITRLQATVGTVTSDDSQHYVITLPDWWKATEGMEIHVQSPPNSLPQIARIRQNGVQICGHEKLGHDVVGKSRKLKRQVESIFELSPRRALSRPRNLVTIHGHSDVPLWNCSFTLPNQQVVDFSLGHASFKTKRYSYSGLGLDQGDCGMVLMTMDETYDGIVLGRVRRVNDEDWHTSAMLIRVTGLSDQSLPRFTIDPDRAALKPGDSTTICCDADRSLEVCQFLLPDGRNITFEAGNEFQEVADYSYHGSGLSSGQCGITLSSVDDRLNGPVVCRLGKKLDSTEGAWDAAVIDVLVQAEVFELQPRHALSRPRNFVHIESHSSTPLRNCVFTLPNKQVVDLSLGHGSAKAKQYSYRGLGLEQGDCGLSLQTVDNTYEGVVTARIRRVDDEQWLTSSMVIRVTGLSDRSLPSFSINPKRAAVKSRERMTVQCNADRSLEVCQFVLPDDRIVEFRAGGESQETSEYKYHGTGLYSGQCGVTFTSVDARFNGPVVCKVGKQLDSSEGAWDSAVIDVSVQGSTTAAVPILDGIVTQQPWTSPQAAVTPSPRQECGRASPALTLVLGGESAAIGQWPWHVAMFRIKKDGELGYSCGGTLVSDRLVITAAHCVTSQPFGRPVPSDSIKLFLGMYHIRRFNDNGLQNNTVDRVIVHPLYNQTTFKHDVAILVLSADAQYTQYVRPACLWNKVAADIEDVVDRAGTIVGWGFDDSYRISDELNRAEMPVVRHDTCLFSNPTFYSVYTSENTFCAGFRNGTSVCNGDSGGGMVFPTRQPDRSNRWFLRGVVSNSVPRKRENSNAYVCDPTQYVVFTDLAKYIPWITSYLTA